MSLPARTARACSIRALGPAAPVRATRASQTAAATAASSCSATTGRPVIAAIISAVRCAAAAGPSRPVSTASSMACSWADTRGYEGSHGLLAAVSRSSAVRERKGTSGATSSMADRREGRATARAREAGEQSLARRRFRRGAWPAPAGRPGGRRRTSSLRRRSPALPRGPAGTCTNPKWSQTSR